MVFSSLRRASCLGLLIGATSFSTGCLEKKKPPEKSTSAAATAAPAPTIDKAAFESSWLLGVARDPKPLVELAGTSEGWRLFFTGQTREALEGFLGDLDASPAARIGAARAALELARAHARLGYLVRAVTPELMKAQSTRPGAQTSAPWRSYVEGRLAQVRGKSAVEAFGAIPDDAPAKAWAVALEGDTPLAALMTGKAAGVDAEVPAGGTSTYEERLRIAALVDAGRLKEARSRFKRLDPRAADIEVGEGTQRIVLRDPAVADVGARVYAALVVELLAEASGWPLMLRAEALSLLGRTDDALASIDTLNKARPSESGLAMLVLTDMLDNGDLGQAADAAKARLLAEKGDEAGARALVDAMPRKAVGQRVIKAWAGSFVGLVDAEAFPEDRTQVSKALLDVLAAGGDQAPGLSTLADLSLVDRYVDGVQRRFAEALIRMDRPALAVKMREAAEDKSSGQAPSARNTLSALTAAALDNVAIGRPRVALKYLSRMADALPAAAGPAEMLRDLLSHRAMEHSGGATSGQ